MKNHIESIFKIETKIPDHWQQKLIDWVEDKKNNPNLVYRWHPYRWVVDLHNISLETRELFPRRDRLDFSNSCDWRWISEHGELDWMSEFLFWIRDQAKSYFAHVGTISLQIWEKSNPGLAPHFDFRMHKMANHPRGEFQETQFWRLFFPISEKISDELKDPPFYLLEENSESFITSEGCAYFMHDPTCLHGVKPRTYSRGFVFVDGILNKEIFNGLDRQPLILKGKTKICETWKKNYILENDLIRGPTDSRTDIQIQNNLVLENARRSVLLARANRKENVSKETEEVRSKW